MKKLILSIIITGFAFANAHAASCNEEKENNWYIQGTGSFGWHNKTKASILGFAVEDRQKNGLGGSPCCWTYP